MLFYIAFRSPQWSPITRLYPEGYEIAVFAKGNNDLPGSVYYRTEHVRPVHHYEQFSFSVELYSAIGASCVIR